jgi:hypothetical protein
MRQASSSAELLFMSRSLDRGQMFTRTDRVNLPLLGCDLAATFLSYFSLSISQWAIYSQAFTRDTICNGKRCAKHSWNLSSYACIHIHDPLFRNCKHLHHFVIRRTPCPTPTDEALSNTRIPVSRHYYKGPQKLCCDCEPGICGYRGRLGVKIGLHIRGVVNQARRRSGNYTAREQWMKVYGVRWRVAIYTIVFIRSRQRQSLCELLKSPLEVKQKYHNF